MMQRTQPRQSAIAAREVHAPSSVHKAVLQHRKQSAHHILPVRSNHLPPRPLLTQQCKASAASSDPLPGPSQSLNPDGSTFTQAVLNVVNIMMGVGLLTLPFALKSSGWVGVGLLWLMGFIANYSGKVIVECANQVALKGQLSAGSKVGFEEIADAAFGSIGKLVVSAIIYVELFGTCSLLYILEGDNLFRLLGTSVATSAQAYMMLAAMVVLPTMWLPDLKSLSFLGAAGLTATVTVCLSVLFTLLTGSYVPGAHTDFANWATLPLVFGIMTFCYSGHGVFPSIQAAMKEPEQFPKVLDAAFLIVAALCTIVGGAGYYMYGSGALDVVTFNLPTGFLSTLCACVILVNPVAKFALTLEPVSAAFQGLTSSTQGVRRVLARTVLALMVLYAAMSIPFLASLMALIGSFLTISVSVTLPAMCQLILFKGQLSLGRTIWNYFVALVGIGFSGFGTYAALKNIASRAAAGA